MEIMEKATLFLRKKGLNHGFKLKGGSFNATLLELLREYENELLSEIRQVFADYYRSEGCECCQDRPSHEKAEEKLGELLSPDKYDDESGFNWYKYVTKEDK